MPMEVSATKNCTVQNQAFTLPLSANLHQTSQKQQVHAYVYMSESTTGYYCRQVNVKGKEFPWLV